MTNVYKTLTGLSRPWIALILPLFLFLFSWNNADATCCNVNFPSMTAQNGCATLGSIPVGQCGDQVEWMWAQNVNGSIVGLTGFSTSQLTAWCPSAAGNFRICARVIGCSTIYESSDVYVNPSCCEVNFPTISAVNGCAQLSGAPTAVCGGSVEWMWAQNINGSIVGLTGFSTTQALSWCPTSAGNFRICVRKVGCSAIYESGDVYVDPATCTGSITGIYVYDQLTDARAIGLPALYNGLEIDLGSLPANYYLVAELSGNAESIRMNLNGNQIVENTIPYTFPANAQAGTNWNGGIGSYTITATSFLQDNAAGQQCDLEAVSFSIVDASCATITNGSSPYQENDPIFQQVIAADSYCCNTWWDDTCEDQYIDIITNGDPETICTLDGYQAVNGRIFWIPNFATDYRNSGAGLSFAQYADGSAHVYGLIESAANTNKKFKVSIWFNNKSNYTQWLAAGKQAKSPELGDESTWTFYMHDEVRVSYLQGLGGNAGQLLYIHEMDNNFGLQIGDGANALNTNANGMSMWFDHVGTNVGHGDLNATFTCPPTCGFTLTTTTNETACNANDGTLIVCPAQGSNTALPYTLTYTFNGNPYSVGPFNTFDPISISGLEPGAYTNLIFTDANGCSETQAGPFNIIENQDCGNCDFVVLDQWDNNYNCYICSDGFTSTILAAYGGNAGDVIQFQDPVCNPNECISSITVTFNVAAADYSLSQSWGNVQQIATAYPIEINGQVIGYYDPTELPYICNVCEPEDSKTVTFNVDPATFNYNYGGLNTFDSNFYQFGNDNGILQDVCVANIELAFNTTSCDPCVNSTLSVNAGDDQIACGTAEATFTASVSGAADCTTQSNSDCNHTLGVTGGWLENPSASAVCGDNAGTKLWTQSGQGTSFVTLDLGVEVPAGTQICANMKLEHCNGSASNNSSAKIKASTSPNSGFVTVVSTQTFSNNSYQEFCYTLAAPARYIRVQDNGSCAFRLDYVEYTTQGTAANDITYAWSGPGIVGAANSATVVANAAGTYTVTVTDCSGCTATDEVNLTVDPTELEIKNLGDCIVDVYEWLPSGDQFVIELGPGEHIIVTTHVGAMWRIVADNWNTAAFDEQYEVVDCEDQVWNVAPDYCNPDCDLSVSIDAEPGLSVCEGESITLTSNASGETVCDEIIACYTMSNATAPAGCFPTPGTGVVFQRAAGCAGSHTIWQAGNDLKLTEYADNTARITGSITRNGQVGILDVALYDKANNGTTWNAQCYLNGINGPKTFYTSFLGTITINGEVFTVEEKVSEQHYILANGAGFNSNQFGLGAWTAGTFGGCTEWFANLTPCDIPSLETTYAWSTGETTESIVVNESGTYSVTVTDCAGCVAQDEVTITILDLPEVSVSSTNPVCLENDGTITFSFNDNPNRTNIEFSLDGGATYPLNVNDNAGSASFNNLSAGTYNLFVRWGNDECPVDLGPITLTTIECASLGNFVWYDTDRDGIQDAGEAGVEGVTVELFICGETDAIASTETDENGLYLFSNLEPGVSYYVVFSGLPADYVFSPQNIGDDALDSDAGLNGATACVELAPGEFNDTLDAGINNPTGSIGDYVWEDVDQDGFQDAGENGVEGITVELFICGETDAIQSTETDENGLYLFSNLEPGVSYYVVFSGLPAGYDFTTANSGDDASDSDADENGATACYELGIDEDYLDFDAGIFIPTNIGNFVWYDNDNDGIQDAGENGVEGVTVNLVTAGTDGVFGTADDVTVATQNTDENGFYLFEDVLPGEYIIVFDPSTLPTDFVFTALDKESDDELDSDANPLTGATAPFTVVYGQDDDLSFDAGITTCPYPVLEGAEPQDITINCDATVPVAAILTFSDFIYGLSNVNYSFVQNDLDCGFEIVRTWTATNECGNTTVVDQTITVIDNVGPVITFQTPDQTIECDQEIPQIVVTYLDNCDNDLFLEVDNWVNDLDCGFEYVKWCRATDDCGNSNEATVTITVLDTTAPVATFTPASVTIECDEVIPTEVPTFVDNCDDNLQIIPTSSEVALSCGYEIHKSWTAIDDCENETTVYQVITVLDTTKPVFTSTPDDFVVNCDNGSSDPQFAGMPVVTDNCDDNVSLTYVDGTAGTECPASFERVWTAVDNCGNEEVYVQIITINDSQAPVLDAPADITVECTDSTEPSNTGQATATDDCSSPTVYYTDGPVSGTCPYTFERTWTAIDPCGNTSTEVQIITIDDTIAPVADGVGQELTISCEEDLPAVGMTFTDNCDQTIEVTVTTWMVPVGCLYDFYQSCTATDDCGNSTTVTSVIHVVDVTAPVLFGVPADATINCNDAIPAAIVYAQDNCDDNVIVALSASTQDLDCGYQITRTWSAVDECGNPVSATQILTVTDTEAPVIVCPAAYTVNCDNGSADPEFAGEPVVTDNCSTFTVSYADGIAGEGCPATFERTWTAVDACGNESSCVQLITINDFVSPIIDCPLDITIECTESTDPSNTGVATATDDCSTPIISYVDGPLTGDCPYSFTRIWTATDACGNASNSSQVITIIDTVAPVLSGQDEETTIECNMAINLVAPTATDNCDDDVEITPSMETFPGDCPNSWTEVYTWTATDNCGNQSARTFTVNYEDTTAPVLYGVPADATINCNDAIPAAIVYAQDNCDDNVIVALSASTQDLACGYQITRTWSAVDACGNPVSATQILTVTDTEAPVIVCPAAYTVNCDNGSADPEFAGEPVVTDNCSTFTVSYADGIAGQGCPATFERTWTAVDACGNESSCVQLITINDFMSPIIDCPLDITIECTESTDPSNTGAATATDDCSTPIISYVDGEVLGDCPYSFTRIWTATDACGNASNSSQVITIIDTVAPVLSGQDEETTIECNMAINLVAPTATDNCDDDVEITPSMETFPGDCPNSWTEVYTWTATDNCGNQSARTFTVNYEDTTAPEFNEEVIDITVECDAVPALPILTAWDNCDNNIIVEMSEQNIPDDCGYKVEVTYTATDDCGNSNSVSFIMSVVDTTAPYVISAPADVTIECGQPEPTEVPVFGDNCDTMLEPFAISGIGNVTNCGYTIERTWGVTDDCGNTTSVSQTITVIDTTAPELEGVPADITVNCEEIPAPAVVTATDACDTNPMVEMTEILGSGCPYTIVRTWTATDVCGNESEMSQTITVIDNIAPILVGVPADYTGECGLAPSPSEVTAIDNCSGTIAAILSEEVIGDSCPLTIIRTWTATDNCGNVTTASQTIVINDETAPVFVSGPADETVECDMVPAPATDEIAVDDNCDTSVDVTLAEVVYPWTSNIPGTNFCGYVIERVWTATDDCGNQSAYLQTINVVDTTSPTLTGVPDDVTVECTNIPSAAQVGAVDNCYTGVMVPSLVESITELTCGYILTRTWTVADDCGNTSTASQEITVVDTQSPYVITTPVDVTVECDQDIPASIATFGDACDDLLDVQVNDQIVPQDCQYYIIRTWTATDDCGNSISTSQNIFVVDNTDPILVGVPASMEVQCSDIPAPAVVTATDNCDDNVVPVYTQAIGSGNCPYTITRTWTATDNCGNTVSSSQILTVIDTIDPVLVGVPADATVECTDIPAPAVVNATDNCADDLVVSFNESIEAADCGYVLYRTWTVYDNCGNMDEATQVLTVVDTTAPFVTFEPADMSFECDEQAPYVTATFADACDDQVEVGFYEQFIPGDCENNYTLVRVWTAIDDCGNEATASQTINVSDTTNPVLIGVPAETTVECDQVPAPAVVDATDNCDSDVNVEYSEVEVPADCGYVITRTWTATDNCGNTVSESQIVNVVDTTAPVVIFNPEDITIECDEAEPTSAPIFEDNCDNDLTIYPSSSISPNDCGYSIERVWTAVDNCGNSVTATQTITVVDTTNPELIGTPADATVQCSDIPAPADVTAVDNCDDDMEVMFNEVALSNGCPYTIERTWTVYDNCGNMDTYTQILTVVDTIVPVLHNVPEDGTAECDNIPAPAFVTATDNCSDNLVVNFEESFEMYDCGYDITRTWSTTDACGNYVSASQVINVLDNTEPILIGVPEDATAECDNIPAVAVVSAEDNCSTDLEVQYSVFVQDLACGSIITRTWTVADACGNSATASQVIEVIDTTAPVIVNGPEDMLVECSEVPGAGVVMAEDNCDNLVDVTMEESTSDLPCGYEITRVWTATDNCGNTDMHTQVITVTDVTAPVILGIPADVTIECGEAVPAPGEVSVNDNCDAQPTVSSSEAMMILDCGYQIVRTYTATDACGNSSSEEQIITVIDTVDPVFVSLPEDITVNCDEVTIAPSLMATDNCDEMVEVIFSEVMGDGCPYTITRTWTAIDDCGNTAIATQIVTVIDEEAPVWDAFPLYISLSCELVDAYTITATDNCDSDVEVTIIEELLFSGGCLGTLQRTYKATDNCGNFITTTQLIQRVDVTAPMIFNVPEDIELTCGDEIPAAAADIFGADNCTSNVEITFEEIQTNEFCPYEIIRTWTAIDDCGNATEGVQVITVTVETPPVVNLISFPNPFDDKFTVEFSVPSDAKVAACVYDMIGKEVMPIFQGDVDANRLYTFNYGSLNWEAGTYIIMMVVDDQVYHHKMIVTHR